MFLLETQISFPTGGRLPLLQEDSDIFLVISEHLRGVAGTLVYLGNSPASPVLLERPQLQRAGLQPLSLRLSSLTPTA